MAPKVLKTIKLSRGAPPMGPRGNFSVVPKAESTANITRVIADTAGVAAKDVKAVFDAAREVAAGFCFSNRL